MRCTAYVLVIVVILIFERGAVTVTENTSRAKSLVSLPELAQ